MPSRSSYSRALSWFPVMREIQLIIGGPSMWIAASFWSARFDTRYFKRPWGRRRRHGRLAGGDRSTCRQGESRGGPDRLQTTLRQHEAELNAGVCERLTGRIQITQITAAGLL